MPVSPVEMCGKTAWLRWKYSNGDIRQLEKEKITEPTNKHGKDSEVQGFSLFFFFPSSSNHQILSNPLFPRTKLEISQSINRWPLWSLLPSSFGSR